MDGKRIQEIRLSKKLGLNETANKAGISGSYLSNLENGKKTNPSTETIQNIANALGIDVSDLFTPEEKFNMAVDTIADIRDMAKHALEGNNNDNVNETSKVYKVGKDPDNIFDYPDIKVFDPGTGVTSIQFKDNTFSESEQEEIMNYIAYVVYKREK